MAVPGAFLVRMRALCSLGKSVQTGVQSVSHWSGGTRWYGTKARSDQEPWTDLNPRKPGDIDANLLNDFPHPKRLLHSVINHALGINSSDAIQYSCSDHAGGKKVTLTVLWPCKFEEEGYASKKIDAERAAAAAACQKLKDMGVIGPNNDFPSRRAGSRREWRQSLRIDNEEDVFKHDIDVSKSMSNKHKYYKDVIEENPEVSQAITLFPKPKDVLARVIQRAASRPGKDLYKFETRGGRVKTCELTLNWPEKMTFTATANHRLIAERKAAALACVKFKELSLINEKNQPLSHADYRREQVQAAGARERRPFLIEVPESVEDQIKDFLLEHPVEDEVQKLMEEEEKAAQMEMEKAAQEEDEGEEEDEDDEGDWVMDSITGKPHRPLSEHQAQRLSANLQDKWKNANTGFALELPVDAHREKVLSAVRSSRVTVIAGETGCGKTTRIPRFLLEESVLAGEGATCNILVTQPRRISAVSVAHRVGQEMDPALSRSVGYQVRLESRPPEQSGGALLFLTVGVLLKKLQSNPSLKGISHVVVDEVHERDINTDLLLALLHTCLRDNPDIRVVLMSATGDNQRLSKYFGGCPIVKVPGFMHPVKDRYLEDVLTELGRPLPNNKKSSEEDYAQDDLDLDLVADTIEHVDRQGEPGAILCFLPGWQDIKMVQEKLNDMPHFATNKQMIVPLHSSLSVGDQQAVFRHPPAGQRKIVLTTNIAETSVTIDDIVHVVDAGMHKEQNYDPRTKVSSLETLWISRSNVTQRKGRAGRCQPGHSYHLFSQSRLQSMNPFPIPEILRTPLENLVLQAKIYSPNTKAGDFLTKVLDSPDHVAVKDAVQNLQAIGVLDHSERLTPLGERVACMSCDPRLGKVLVLGVMFRCAFPLMCVAACLTRDPFRNVLSNRANVTKAKDALSQSSYSDYLMLSEAVAGYRKIQQQGNREEREEYLNTYCLSPYSLRFINGLLLQFSDNLTTAELVNRSSDCLRPGALLNKHSSDKELLKAVLVAGLFPNLIQVKKGFVAKGGRFRPDSLVFRTRTGPVMLHRTTVNRGKDDLPSRWLTFFSAVKSNEQVFIRDSSSVHPLALLLLADGNIEERVRGDRVQVSFTDHGMVRCEMKVDTWDRLWELRTSIHTMLYRNLSDPRNMQHYSVQDNRLISLLVQLLNSTDSNPFTQGTLSDSEVD